MTIYYLYVKTHKITGLKYLGQTTRNPQRYRGSGVDWTKHLTEFGAAHSTEVIKECSSRKELTFWGRHYSLKWNIVAGMDDFGNKIWANRIPESGGGENFNRREDGTSIQTDKVKAGIHPWMRRPDGSSLSSDRIANGTSHFLKRGLEHHSADHTLYTFINMRSGEKVTMAQRDFINKYKVNQGNLNSMIHNKKKSVKGWFLS